ncbi:E3 ubiquitin-protein ligase mind-bomb-like isoform X1 [Halichondria panicea]|uniref:E3 ubiquitin-protein ligase mind-bomb-like isoform X1 n=1 Tax=Halichondria panicea TaxID=6063 RepID=UPI00312B7A7B
MKVFRFPLEMFEWQSMAECGRSTLRPWLPPRMRTLLNFQVQNPAVIVAAAAAGDANTLREFLRKHPTEVNTKAAGKAAIHCACAAGNVDVLKVIMHGVRPQCGSGDEDGDRPLHLCAYSDEDEATTILIDAGADVNSKNSKGASPLIIAAVKGHYSVLRKPANHPNIKLHEQDSDGDTALHCAVLAQKNESVTILLDAGADPTLLNFRLFTPIHEAARIGFLPAVEHFNRRFVEHINLFKDDGYTPLHLAALNDHLDVITAFAEVVQCDLNAKTNQGQTALHLAVHQGHARIIERLVGFGVDMNILDSDGDTALHMAVVKETVDNLTQETPQLKKVKDRLPGQQLKAVIPCFLVQEGSEMFKTNKKGRNPLEVCSPDVATIVMGFDKDGGGVKFHGSLKSPAPPVVVQGTQRGPLVYPTPLRTGSATHHPPTASLPVGVMDTAGATGGGSVGVAIEPCFLCEAPVDVKFEPCGHAVMCAECAQRAKKCPTCKAAVKTISKLSKVCMMCNEEEATATVKPCDHTFCPECARRMKTCFECPVLITAKEGLPPVSATSVHPLASPDSESNCPICLTEPKNTAFLCGHQTCWDCAQKVDHCPVCRKFVTHRIQLFQ